MASPKRKSVLNAALKALLAGAETSAAIKIPSTFISELASLPDDKQQLLAGMSQEQFNELLNQSELATINAAVSAANTEQIKSLVQQLISKIDDVTDKLNQKKIFKRDKHIHNLPYPSIGDLFKGRADIIKKLKKLLAGKKVTAITQVHAIHGLGGIGKTRLAVEFACQQLNSGEINAAFFVLSDSIANLTTTLAALAAPSLLDLEEHKLKDQPAIVEAVLARLSQRTDYILIFDNVEDSDTKVDKDDNKVRKRLDKILARLTGRILITSRMSNWTGSVKSLPIDKLHEKDAVAYLLDKTKEKRSASENDKDLVKRLAKELDGLPIALEQAAAYINHRRIGFSTYLEDFAKARKKVLEWHKGDLQDYPVAVLSAWQTTEEHLGPGERSILRLVSFLAPEAIPTKLFESQPKQVVKAIELLGKEERTQTGSEDKSDELDVRAILADLAAWSMINLTKERCIVHRLVQESVRLRIGPENRRNWVELALHLVREYIPKDVSPDDVRSWPVWEIMAPHVSVVAEHADQSEIPEPTGWLMNSLGMFFLSKASFEITEQLFRRVLSLNEKIVGPDHKNTATCLNNLAELLRETGRFKEAEPMYHRALKIDEASFGPAHPSVARDLNNLALLLNATNRLDEAEPMYRRALAIDEASFGPDHPKVAIRLNNLALLLKTTNSLDEAEPMYRRALAIDEASLGPAHPSVARDLNNLTLLLRATGRLAEAEPLMQRSLTIVEASFGPNHPNVANVLNNLAALLADTNRFEEAEPMYHRALTIFEACYGPDHPNVAFDLNNLAGLLQDTNRLAEAEPMYHRALKIFEASFGTDHPSTITVRNNLEILKKKMNP